MSSREELIFKAKLAEQVERYDEMADLMKQALALNSKGSMTAEESLEERNLLSVAFKNAVGTRRAALRIVNAVEARQRTKGNQMQLQVAREYQEKVSQELYTICEDVVALLTEELKKENANELPDTKVFYEKMIGDYYRYICEASTNPKKAEATENAKAAYMRADAAAKTLAVINPVRLGLALNFSVFYYEIIGSPADACRMAQEAFDLAIVELDQCADEQYKDSQVILHLLRDNLTLWMNNDDNKAAAPTNAPEAPPVPVEGA